MKKLAIVIATTLVLSGCISPKIYVDPSFAKASYSDIKSVSEKHAINLVTEFQRNGKHFARADQELRDNTIRVLRATGVVDFDKPSSGVTLKVIINNVADTSKAAAKGFATGLTFGAVGSSVADFYEVTIEYTEGDAPVQTFNYKHAIHTTIGNADAPVENVAPTTAANAFAKVVEDSLLNFINDIQKAGKLTHLNNLPSALWLAQSEMLSQP